MKQLKEIHEKINSLMKETPQYKKARRRYEKEMQFLRSCQFYLETEPTEKFLGKQLTECKRRIEVINEGFLTWLQTNPKDAECKNPKSKYRSLMGYRTIQNQIRTLEFLIKS